MKRLILMRHAKSDWSGGPSSDHDRPLNARGRAAAASLGTWLKSNHLIPDQVLCSSAVRTRETYDRLDMPEIDEVRYDRSLYLAEPEMLMTTLRIAIGDCVLIIGHNPGSAMMADAILDDAPDDPHFMAYPTGATLVADFDIDDWTQADWGNAKARHFTVPRNL